MLNFQKRKNLSEEGVWHEWGGAKFLIAHMSNIVFQRALSRAQQPHRKKLEAGTLDPLIMRKVTCQAMSEGMLLDWADVCGDDGVATPYEPKHGFTMLMNDPEFREFVSDVAMNLTNFHEAEVEELGNASQSGQSG